MTIAELIKKLEKYPEDTVVLIWDDQTGLELPITGFLYDGGSKELNLLTEDDDDFEEYDGEENDD